MFSGPCLISIVTLTYIKVICVRDLLQSCHCCAPTPHFWHWSRLLILSIFSRRLVRVKTKQKKNLSKLFSFSKCKHKTLMSLIRKAGPCSVPQSLMHPEGAGRAGMDVPWGAQDSELVTLRKRSLRVTSLLSTEQGTRDLLMGHGNSSKLLQMRFYHTLGSISFQRGWPSTSKASQRGGWGPSPVRA